MVGLKNCSPESKSFDFAGVSYNFRPGELLVMTPHIAQHIIKASATCAIGGSPMKLIMEKDIPAEVAMPGAVQSSVTIVLRNISDSAVSFLDDGIDFTIPAGGCLAFPQAVGARIYSRHVSARLHQLSLDVPEAVKPSTENYSPDNPLPAPSEEPKE